MFVSVKDFYSLYLATAHMDFCPLLVFIYPVVPSWNLDTAFSACYHIGNPQSPYFPCATKFKAAMRQCLPVSLWCRTVCPQNNC